MEGRENKNTQTFLETFLELFFYAGIFTFGVPPFSNCFIITMHLACDNKISGSSYFLGFFSLSTQG